ncbi:DNA binding domain-containing protein [Parelusimicrobium proximum]|uniref:helix-turn-helix transcriptional regulator n=1 Tax=Parelusimicrobium proximum TaxID=3228953 RepID=UPI003D164590
MKEKKLMDIKELAEYLSMPTATLYTMKCERRFPAGCVVKIGRSLRFDKAAIDNWIEEQKSLSSLGT